MSAPNDTVSIWLSGVDLGTQDRISYLFDRYFQRLVQLAAARLRSRPELAGCGEDVALSAFKSLCCGVEAGRVPDLSSRDELWKLLAVITVRKAIDLHRKKRTSQFHADEDLEEILCNEPAPDEVAEVSDRVNSLLEKLGDAALRQIALWKVEGYTNEEIARRTGCVVRTIERKLLQIRLLWQQEVPA
jgi:RNA polymerase sigma factor (sigma-70 family)